MHDAYPWRNRPAPSDRKFELLSASTWAFGRTTLNSQPQVDCFLKLLADAAGLPKPETDQSVTAEASRHLFRALMHESEVTPGSVQAQACETM